MPQAKKADTVTIHYTGKLEDGTVFATSRGDKPLSFKIGNQEIIPGLEEAIVGMSPGQTKTADVPAESGFGPRRDDRVVTVERSNFPAHIEPKTGQVLEIPQPNGPKIVATITQVTEAEVTVDANHPLAGKKLFFDVELIKIG